MIFKTPDLNAYVARYLAAQARALVADVPADLLARTAAFLLLKDSRSSFEIEGEDRPQDRIQRWGQVIGGAGRRSIDLHELLRLQRIVIGDARFVQLGLRTEGGFVGEHDRNYRRTLESYSRRLLPLIRWVATERGNVEVLSETADFYRFFDATPHAEFLFSCVARTVDLDLPAGTAFLAGYDTFRKRVSALVDMPDRIMDLLFRFLRQNDGALSKRAREREFAQLTDA